MSRPPTPGLTPRQAQALRAIKVKFNEEARVKSECARCGEPREIKPATHEIANWAYDDGSIGFIAWCSNCEDNRVHFPIDFEIVVSPGSVPWHW